MNIEQRIRRLESKVLKEGKSLYQDASDKELKQFEKETGGKFNSEREYIIAFNKWKKQKSKVKESRFSENIDIDEIEPGDYVDFGSYGKLWICSIDDDQAWVTDDEDCAGDPDASGWSIRLSYAKRILNR